MASETVQIALITASSGLMGSIFGAVGAIFGPWWIKSFELKAEKLANEREARRKAVVNFANSLIVAMQSYRQVFILKGTDDQLQSKIESLNISINELYSLIRKEDCMVKTWLNKMMHTARCFRSEAYDELAKADAFLGVGIQYLLAWHSGEIDAEDLKPFGLDGDSEPVWLESWDSQWPK